MASGGDPDARDPETGKTLIHRALESDRWQVAEALAAAGADLDLRDAGGSPALHEAMNSDFLDESASDADMPRTSRLLELGADPQARDAQGRDARAFAESLSEGYGRIFEEIVAEALKIRTGAT